MGIPPEKLQRIVMHDNTNISLNEALDDTQHKSTRSDYYKECFTKGGDACQPCSWNIGTYLVTGDFSDYLYVELIKILEQQIQFQDFYLDRKGLKNKFINIFDKGY